MKKQDNNVLIIVLAVLLAVLFFGGFGMMSSGFGMGRMMYGNDFLCGNIGGIWCYFPIFGFIFNLVFWIAIFVLVYLIIKHLQKKEVENEEIKINN